MVVAASCCGGAYVHKKEINKSKLMEKGMEQITWQSYVEENLQQTENVLCLGRRFISLQVADYTYSQGYNGYLHGQNELKAYPHHTLKIFISKHKNTNKTHRCFCL
ncbi:hypothetical protein ILYODFUR_022080 [Ilyodon furcidens]|uniref:Uncharacterized protein n=1 Tax=Ilyodon furcidens TaxID=33524 RepID=A0ABV0UJK0_9TELE